MGPLMRDRNDGAYGHPLHHNECPDCHGFYCRTCKSTVPPKYRPFWDEDEDPELIKYYKRLQIESEKSHCAHCHNKKRDEEDSSR